MSCQLNRNCVRTLTDPNKADSFDWFHFCVLHFYPPIFSVYLPGCNPIRAHVSLWWRFFWPMREEKLFHYRPVSAKVIEHSRKSLKQNMQLNLWKGHRSQKRQTPWKFESPFSSATFVIAFWYPDQLLRCFPFSWTVKCCHGEVDSLLGIILEIQNLSMGIRNI